MKKLVILLLLQASFSAQNGRTVSGNVTPAPGAAAAAQKAVRVALVSSGTPAQTLDADVNADGSFRITGVRPGPYLVRLLPINNGFRSDNPYPAQAVFVGDRDITGFLLSGPVIVMGRVEIEGGGRVPVSPLNLLPETASVGNIEIRPGAAAATGSALMSGRVRPDHTFVVGVPPGEYRLSPRFASDYSVRSISYGGINLLQDSLKVSGPSTNEIVVTLARAPGFAVRGRVTGRPAGPMPPGVFINTTGIGASTSVNADGTFELQGVPPGNRSISLIRQGASPFSGQTTASRLATANVTVTDKDIENVELAWTPLTPITGKLVLQDKSGMGMPGVPPGANVTLTSRDGKAIAGGCDTPRCRPDILSLYPQPDGSLNRTYPLLVPTTVADVAVTPLPPGYVVKAITSGTVDLLSNPLRIEATTNAVDIEVVVQNTNGVRVAGRVIPTPEAPLIPSRVSLNIPPGLTRPAIQSTVASDGTFQFAGVSPGVYTLTSDPNGLLFMGSTTANIVVGDQDITNVPLIGLSDAFIPNTIQYANEAAAVLNINTIQSAQIYFNGHRQRYGSLDELIADGFLSPSYARPISGYTISVTSSGSEITGTALPVTAADGRYEFYFSRNGGARALRLTGPPATTPRAVTLNTLEQVSTCGSDAPL
jgi:hypothetical protein